VEHKADGSPLTIADRASHEHIVSRLAEFGEGYDLLSEEGDIDAFLSRRAEVFWLIDPLDGTKEFVNGLGEYTVNIALVDHGSPVLGVVYAPALGVTWYGSKGKGAYRMENGGEPQAIKPSEGEKPTSAVVSRSHLSEATREFLDKHGITETTPRGSSVKICAIAEGTADIYPRQGPTSIWDTAAGTAVARASGCSVVDLDGNYLDYDPSAGILREGFIVYPSQMAPAIN